MMIVHIDMDAFYASVEQLDNPQLRGKCVIVGRDTSRGVVSAASYEARKFGVRSAMPVFQAKKYCPQGIFVCPRIERYKEISKKVMAVLQSFSPLVEPISIDEAFLDVTGCDRLFGGPEEIALNIKEKIKSSVHLTCSVGIAPNKFLAKIASDYNKPDGVKIILPHDADSFIKTLPIEKVPGVGKKTCGELEKLAVKTLGDIQKIPEQLLVKKLGVYGKRLSNLARGIDESPVIPINTHKSISTETTLNKDTSDKNQLKKFILNHSEEVGRELRRHKLKAKTISIKITYTDFKKISRSRTIDTPIQSSIKIFREASFLLDSLNLIKPVRLIGVGTSSLFPESVPRQIGLFSSRKNDDNWDKLDKTIDNINRRFGNRTVNKALLNELDQSKKGD